MALGLWACGAGRPNAAPELSVPAGPELSVRAAPAGPELSAPAAPDTAVEHMGRLQYTPTPATMSLAGYLGDGIRLETPEGVIVLAASETVPEARLADAAGKRVRLRCLPRPASSPAAMEAAPLGPDGHAMPRPAKCETVELTVLGN